MSSMPHSQVLKWYALYHAKKLEKVLEHKLVHDGTSGFGVHVFNLKATASGIHRPEIDGATIGRGFFDAIVCSPFKIIRFDIDYLLKGYNVRLECVPRIPIVDYRVLSIEEIIAFVKGVHGNE